jgi:hypothetical protein
MSGIKGELDEQPARSRAGGAVGNTVSLEKMTMEKRACNDVMGGRELNKREEGGEAVLGRNGTHIIV